MGSHTHTVIIVTSFQKDELVKCAELFKSQNGAQLGGIVVGPYTGLNQYTSYVFMPHGSKDGWPESEKINKLRSEFIEAVKNVEFVEIVETCWGDYYDEPVASAL